MRPSHSLSQSGKSFPTKPEARTMVNGASQKNRIVPSTSRNDDGSVRPSQLAAQSILHDCSSAAMATPATAPVAAAGIAIAISRTLLIARASLSPCFVSLPRH